MEDAGNLFFMLPRWYLGTIAFVFGAIWGSFANVAISRLPEGLSVLWPPSRCPTCSSRIRYYDNIPIFSWFILRGRCRDCEVPISFRYPMVELLVALLSLGIVLRSGSAAMYFLYFTFLLALVILSFIDLDHWMLPDVITLPGIALGLAVSFFHPGVPSGFTIGPIDSVIGAAFGAGILYAVALVFRLVTGKVAMGFGDVKMMAMVGAFLGWRSIVPVIFLSSLQGSLAGIAILLFSKRPKPLPRNEKQAEGDQEEEDFVPTSHHVPYGPFIALGAMEYLFWGSGFFDLIRGLFVIG